MRSDVRTSFVRRSATAAVLAIGAVLLASPAMAQSRPRQRDDNRNVGSQSYRNRPANSGSYNNQSYNRSNRPNNNQPFPSQSYNSGSYNRQSYNSGSYNRQPFQNQSYNNGSYSRSYNQPYNGSSGMEYEGRNPLTGQRTFPMQYGTGYRPQAFGNRYNPVAPNIYRSEHPSWNGNYYWRGGTYYYDPGYLYPATTVDNDWFAIAALMGGVTVLDELGGDPYLMFSGDVGELYPMTMYYSDLASPEPAIRLRASYFQRPYFWRDGVRYDRRTVRRGGREFYEFVRH